MKSYVLRLPKDEGIVDLLELVQLLSEAEVDQMRGGFRRTATSWSEKVVEGFVQGSESAYTSRVIGELIKRGELESQAFLKELEEERGAPISTFSRGTYEHVCAVVDIYCNNREKLEERVSKLDTKP